MVDKVTEMADVFSFVHTIEVKYTPYNGDFIILLFVLSATIKIHVTLRMYRV